MQYSCFRPKAIQLFQAQGNQVVSDPRQYNLFQAQGSNIVSGPRQYYCFRPTAILLFQAQGNTIVSGPRQYNSFQAQDNTGTICFRLKAMRVSRVAACTLLEDPDWGSSHYDMGIICQGTVFPCHQVPVVTWSGTCDWRHKIVILLQDTLVKNYQNSQLKTFSECPCHKLYKIEIFLGALPRQQSQVWFQQHVIFVFFSALSFLIMHLGVQLFR